MRLTRWVVGAAVLAAGAVPGTAGAAQTVATHSENLTPVANVPYAPRNGGTPNYGTDIEFAKLQGTDHALAGSYRNGLQIMSLATPDEPKLVGTYDCGVTQGDVQVFLRSDLPGRTFVAYASDTFGDGTSKCYKDAKALGFDVLKPNGKGKNGFFILEVTNPAKPRTIAFAEVPQGSHNITVHPSGHYVYNSNSDLITSFQPAIEVIDIRNMRVPRSAGELTLPTRPGLGTESHDITFNEDGTRAYSAALSQGVIIDTTTPRRPKMISSFVDPAINVWHQADPFSMTGPDGERRDFVIVEDEFVGAIGTAQCPNGGVHVYDVTGEKEKAPVKVGYWNIDEVRPTTDDPTEGGRCTAHVFDVHEDEQIMTIAYYNGGVRVVDLSGLMGVGLGGATVTGTPMKELAFARFSNSDTWSAKTPKIDPTTGNFFLYGNDVARGLDVYKYRKAAKPSTATGTWMTAAQSRELARTSPRLSAGYKMFCLAVEEGRL